MPTLLLVEGVHYDFLRAKAPPETLYLPLGENTKTVHIGRWPSADMDLYRDDAVSRSHLKIRWVPPSGNVGGHFLAAEAEDVDKPPGQRWPSQGTFVMSPTGWMRLVPGGNVVLGNRDELRLGTSSVVALIHEAFPVIPDNATRAQIDQIHAERRARGLRDARSATRLPDAGRNTTQ